MRALTLLVLSLVALPADAAFPSVLRSCSDAVVQALKDRDMVTVAFFSHPAKTLRFAPYPFFTSSDKKFNAFSVRGLFSDSTVRTWGHYDGSGNPITKTFANYYPEFVWHTDFTASGITVGENVRIKTGHHLTNWATVYPGRAFVEYHFPGTATHSNMDWWTLVLVWLKDSHGAWRLVAVTNDMQGV